MQAYSDPTRADDPHSLPDVEVFCQMHGGRTSSAFAHDRLPVGWYYWFCFPGCLPDSDPTGPFATEAEALADAQSDSAPEWYDDVGGSHIDPADLGV